MDKTDILISLMKDNMLWCKDTCHEMKKFRESLIPSLGERSAVGPEGMLMEVEPLYVSIPDGGDTYALAAGDTYIDFYDGEINKPDGTKDHLRMALKQHGVKRMRSFMIIGDREMKISLDGGGYFTIRAGEGINFGNYPVRQVYIQASQATNIRVVASTAYNMTTFYDRSLGTDNPSYNIISDSLEGVSSAAAQELEVDLGSFSRAKVEIFAKSSVALDYAYWTSPDGEEWFQEQTWNAQTGVHTGYDNAVRYQKITSTAGAAGTVSLYLVAVR